MNPLPEPLFFTVKKAAYQAAEEIDMACNLTKTAPKSFSVATQMSDHKDVPMKVTTLKTKGR